MRHPWWRSQAKMAIVDTYFFLLRQPFLMVALKPHFSFSSEHLLFFLADTWHCPSCFLFSFSMHCLSHTMGGPRKLIFGIQLYLITTRRCMLQQNVQLQRSVTATWATCLRSAASYLKLKLKVQALWK